MSRFSTFLLFWPGKRQPPVGVAFSKEMTADQKKAQLEKASEFRIEIPISKKEYERLQFLADGKSQEQVEKLISEMELVQTTLTQCQGIRKDILDLRPPTSVQFVAEESVGERASFYRINIRHWFTSNSRVGAVEAY